MACEYICDGCGKRQRADFLITGVGWKKPQDWFQRQDERGPQDACSRECVRVIADKTNGTRIVLPL